MLAWVCLANGLWWPGVFLESETKDSMFVHVPNLKIIKLNDKEMIPIDISQEDTVTILTASDKADKEAFFHLHLNQAIPDDQGPVFARAVEELAAQLGLEKSATTATTAATTTTTAVVAGKVTGDETHIQSVKTTKRTTAIPWDDYFMAVAFLSAYVFN
jgi:hypothetical protein